MANMANMANRDLQLQEANKTFMEIQRLGDLVQRQQSADVSAGRKLEFTAGTADPIGFDNKPEIPPVTKARTNADALNILLLDTLKQARGVDTIELQKRQRALQRAILNKQAEITPEELRTLSPSQQASIRAGEVSALRPALDEATFELQKAQSTIDNFENVFNQAREFSSDFAEKIVAPDNVIQSFKKAIEARPDDLKDFLSQAPNDATRQKIIESLDFSTLNKPEKPNLQFISGTANQRAGYFNKATGVFTPIGKADDEPIEDETDDIISNIDEITIKNLKSQVKKVFSPKFANKIILDLNDEQLRLLLIDYQNAQNEAQMSIEPELFYEEWKKQNGIESKTTKNKTELTDEELSQLINKGFSDNEILNMEDEGLSFKEMLNK